MLFLWVVPTSASGSTGPAQFGLAINDWGHRFITQNTLHILHAVMPWRYIHRHPHLPPTAGAINISDYDLRMFQLTPPPYWRAERTRRRQQQYKEQGLDREEYAEDHFTGASGGTVYAGDAFPGPVPGKAEDWQKAGVTGLVSGLKKSDADNKEVLDNITAVADTEVEQAIAELKKLYTQSM